MRGEQEPVTVLPLRFSRFWVKWGGQGIGAHTGSLIAGTTLRHITFIFLTVRYSPFKASHSKNKSVGIYFLLIKGFTIMYAANQNFHKSQVHKLGYLFH